MNNLLKKPLALVSCAALLVAGSVGATVLALNNTDSKTEEDSSASKVSLLAPDSTADLSKDETVYVLAGADGSVKKIIVSDWIQNKANAASFTDKSEMKDVENVKGNESYTMNGDHMRVWDAQGNDIYCQGTIDKELPVSLAVSYTLDGKTVSAEELAGKSGKVVIRYDYRNNQYKMVTVDGKEEKMYVPFGMLTGMLLDNDVFRNVTVTNGKVINDGNRTAVIGLAFPGLQENLNLSKDKLEIPAYVEITADVENFEMTNTVTVATNEIFNKLNTDNLNSVDELTASLNTLNDAMRQLMGGSSQLYGGLTTLLEKSGTLVQGIDALAAGAAQLKTGAGSLDEGTGKLLAGLTELSDHNDALNAGAKTVFGTLLSSVQKQFADAGLTVDDLTIENYKTVLGGLLTAPNDTQKAQLAKLAQPVLDAQLAANHVPEAYYPAVKVLLAQQLNAGKTTDEAMTYIGTLLAGAQQGNPASLQALQQAGQIASTPVGQATIQALYVGLAQQTLAPQVKQAIAGLDSYNEFYTGLQDYTAGVADAKEGAAQLKDGSAQLAAGAAQLYDGVLQLKDGAPALVSGVTQLKDGAMRLSDGLKAFNEQGVKKLTDAVNGDLGGLVTRLKATADVSKAYQSYTGLGDDMDGQVKFIYRTDAVKVQK